MNTSSAPATAATSRLSRVGVGVTLGVLASLAFAASGPFVRSLFAIGWTPGAAVFWRVVIAAALLVPLGLWVMRGRLGLLLGQWRAILLFGGLAVATPQLFYFAAVERMSVSLALLLEYMAPVLLVGLAWVRSRRTPPRLVIAGAAASILGLVGVLDLTGATPDPLGVGFALIAMVGAAAYFVLSARPSDIHPLALAAFGLVAGAGVLGLAILVGALPYAAPLTSTMLLGTEVPWWLPLGVVALIATSLAYSLGIAGISLMGERLASFVSLSEVLFAAALSALMLGEVPAPVQLGGGALIITGVVLIRLAGARNQSAGDVAGHKPRG